MIYKVVKVIIFLLYIDFVTILFSLILLVKLVRLSLVIIKNNLTWLDFRFWSSSWFYDKSKFFSAIKQTFWGVQLTCTDACTCNYRQDPEATI